MLYRVFVTRHYIAVRWFDLEAATERKARNLAERTARRLFPDVRAEACDNGWIADDPVLIDRIGQYGENLEHTHNMVPVDSPTSVYVPYSEVAL